MGAGFLPPAFAERLIHSGQTRFISAGVETMRAEVEAMTRSGVPSTHLRGNSPLAAHRNGCRVHDMRGKYRPLPGTPVRTPDGPPSTDMDVEAVHVNVGIVLAYLDRVLGFVWTDKVGQEVIASVRYGSNVGNAFWDGTGILFGDGVNSLFGNFGSSLEVVAHELMHGVIAHTSGLRLQGEAGALNESFCDILGLLVFNSQTGRDVENAEWRIGTSAVLPGAGLPCARTFTEHKAFTNHGELGDDTQPKHMRDFLNTDQDYGGVHTNSGIPNHAFYLAARSLAGEGWERLGRVWFEAMKTLRPEATFASAAAATIDQAKLVLQDTDKTDIVRRAWSHVGVTTEVM